MNAPAKIAAAKPREKLKVRTAAPAGEALPKLPPSSPEPVPFGRLARAPENVRKTDVAADVEALAEDIAAHGLLQSLIGYAGDTVRNQKIYIVGGGRRLQALQLLRAQGTINDSWTVPVLIRPVADAIELSLSENLQRRDMNPADEFVAFATLMAPGTSSPADLAKRFGFSERYVKQRLKLAALLPEILDALRAGDMTLDAALAYGRAADQDVQRTVFKTQAKRSHDRHSAISIRHAIDTTNKNTDWPVFKFIGAAAYERAGGGYMDADLFGDDAGAARKLDSAFTATRLAHEHVDFQMLRRLPDLADELGLDRAQVTGFVTVEGLEFASYHMAYHAIDKQAPDGWAWVGNDYNPDQVDRMLKTIRNNRILVQLPVGINGQGELIRIDKGFFVPKDQARAVGQQPADRGVNWNPKTQAELDAERRQAEIRDEAARIAVGNLAGTPLEGRAFWPRRGGFGIDAFRPTELPDRGKGVFVAVQVFVPDAEIEARLTEGEQLLDRRRAEEAAAKAEKERLAAERKAGEGARWDELRALDPAPEVLLHVNGDLWVKTPEGWTIEGEEDDVGYSEEFAGLLEHLGPGDVEAWWQTRAEYDASRAGAAEQAEAGR